MFFWENRELPNRSQPSGTGFSIARRNNRQPPAVKQFLQALPLECAN
jgi:hypothetical protein